MYAITAQEVTKIYKNKKVNKIALDKVSFSIKEGEIYGIIGPNGAGKTTTIKILATMLLPDGGSVNILGYDIKKDYNKIRSKINFVLGGEKGVYSRLTAREYLEYFCVLYKIPKIHQYKLINELLRLVDLEEVSDTKRIYTFSKGMIQRLHIARSLINDPLILFLDEPTIGLDPIGARQLKSLLLKLSNNGKTIILTTHYMQEAEDLCNRISFMNNGEIILTDTPENIKAKCRNMNKYEVMIKAEDLDVDKIKSINFVENVKVSEIKDPYYTVNLTTIKDIDEFLISSNLSKYVEVINFTHQNITLDDAYIYHVEERNK